MIKYDKQKHNGADFHNFCFGADRAGVLALGSNKIVLNGELRISMTENSYKYDSELQFRILTPKGSGKAFKKARHNSAWDTVEINIPIEDLDEVILVLKEIKAIKEQMRLKNEY